MFLRHDRQANVTFESLAKQISVANRTPFSMRGKQKVASMTVNIPSSVAEVKLNVVELKLDRLIDEMRFLRSTTIAFDRRLRGIEAYLNPSERQPEANPRRGWRPLLARRQGQLCLQSG